LHVDLRLVEAVRLEVGRVFLDLIGINRPYKVGLKRTDAGHITYAVTIDDPVYYTKPWTNERTFTVSNGEILEYSCEENNKSLWEGRIKLWLPPGTSQPRTK